MARVLSLILAAALLLAGDSLRADEPADLFLRAYQEFQSGERLERDGRPQEALKRYATSVELLETLSASSPDWQRMVVEYRLRKGRERLVALRDDVDLLPGDSNIVEVPLPSGNFDIDIPAPSVATRPPTTRRTSDPASAALERQLAAERRRIAELELQLRRTTGQLTGARAEIEKTKTDLVETRSLLTQTEAALENASRERDELRDQAPAAADTTALQADIAALEEENTRLRDKLDRAATFVEESKSVLEATEADRQALAAERDEAKEQAAEAAELAKQKEALEQQLAAREKEAEELESLRAQNASLAEKLAAAEAADPAEIENLRLELDLANERLGEARSSLLERDTRIKDLAAQLDKTSGELAALQLDPPPGEDQTRALEENAILRAIVLRQLKSQNERRAAVAELEAELDNLRVESGKLAEQLAIINRPNILTQEELLLFREPEIALSHPDADRFEVEMTVVKQGDDVEQPPAEEPAIQGPGDLSMESRALVLQAVELARERRFSDAEALYQQVVETAPENPFALSNLAVAQIQTGKIAAAKVALQKALSIDPGDTFAAINLANVLCRQEQYGDAIEILKEILKTEPKNAVAHNYMAIALGKTGNRAEAEEFFQRSIMLDANYHNAHFNLAVMYANSEPPMIELAKKHYEQAVILGAPPDVVLERRLMETTR
jgi:tetratricopeptide (TPR) repeat protein